MVNFFILVWLVFGSLSALAAVAEHTVDPNQQCQSCHQSEHSLWQQSDHAKAMAVANKQSVLGDFSGVEVQHFGQKAIFFIKDNQFMVTVSFDDNSDTYPIKHTFGHYPLQQYLVETEPGRRQVLPFAWVARPNKEGGQRWFHLYDDQEIIPQDRLHWRQPLQNWNGMCADCHSDGLKRNYDIDNNTFATTSLGINVGCISCHGDLSDHQLSNTKLTPLQSQPSTFGAWLRGEKGKTAHWQGKPRDNSFMEACFSCHSLRAPLTDGIDSNTALLDQFMPQFLTAPQYYVDGQIKEEVYVYGSFQQSKMFAAGVNCLDCHDKHSMKIKIEGNGLCLQCHSNEVYDVKSHHRHQADSSGAQCVNCHMTTNRYMGVDDRRDHSFKIPRPDVSSEFGTPNACVSCHDKKSNQWAEQVLASWHGKVKPLSPTRHNYYQLHRGQRISLVQHLAIIADQQIDVITRATAISLLNQTTNELNAAELTPYFTHREQLLRLAAAGSAVLLPIEQRIKFIAPLLKDRLKAVRVAAARSLIDSGITVQQLPVLKLAFAELQLTNELSSWRGEGRLNQGSIEFGTGQFEAAQQSFMAVIKIEPYFEAGYLNLAQFYRAQQQAAQEQSVLVRGMSKLPTSAALQYAYALSLIRQQQHPKALSFFERAMTLQPTEQQYVYAYILALDGQNKAALALSKLQQLIVKHPNSQQLKDLGLYLANKEQNQQAYDWFYRR